MLFAAINNLNIVDESAVSWEQVIEFRKDTEALIKYRRMIRWIDSELVANSPREVEDLIAFRLDEYGWAVKKHGVRTILGSLSCLLDPKMITATSAAVAATSVAASPLWGGVAAGMILVGRAVVQFGTSTIDGLEERRKDPELAYLYEVQQALE